MYACGERPDVEAVQVRGGREAVDEGEDGDRGREEDEFGPAELEEDVRAVQGSAEARLGKPEVAVDDGGGLEELVDHDDELRLVHEGGHLERRDEDEGPVLDQGRDEGADAAVTDEDEAAERAHAKVEPREAAGSSRSGYILRTEWRLFLP